MKLPFNIGSKSSAVRSTPRNGKNYLPLIVLVVAVFGVVGFLAYSVSKAFSNKTSGDSRVEIADAKSTFAINKNLEYPIVDAEGAEVTRLKLSIDNAELRDELIVKGRRVTSVKGRTFLVVTMRATNDYSKPLEMKMADYVRLTVNGNELEFLAPEVHSDPVLVQSISTKLTRVAFPVNDTDTSLVLWVGEVIGSKERIEIKF